jgi:hypothetical protein
MRQLFNFVRVDQHGGISDNFGHGGRVRGDDWRATSHGLQGGKPEAFVKRGINEELSSAVEASEVGLRDVT